MKILFKIFLLMLFAGPVFAANYYVDCSLSDPNTGEDGSYGNPWNSVKDVNDATISDGDDVYFKVNTTCNVSERLKVDWDGASANNRTIIGAYYGENQFGLNGNSRPIIDGGGTVPSSTGALIQYSDVVGADATGYVTIQDMHVRNSNSKGITIGHSYVPERLHNDNNIIRNCWSQNTEEGGLNIARGSYNIIEDNICQRASMNLNDLVCIDISGLSLEDVSLYNVVRRNVVLNSAEGIGVYKGPRYTTVEHNVVYDCKKYHIYVANSRDNIIRYNLVYENAGGIDGDQDYGIALHCEGNVPAVIKVTGNNEVYGNLVAGTSRGIHLGNECAPFGVYQTNNKIYNNTLVDNNYNFRFEGVDANWSNNLYRNNISLTVTGGGVSNHSSSYSPDGVTWSHNNFDETVSGKAMNNAVIGDPNLSKTSGWRTLPSGNTDGMEFQITTGSAALNSGMTIASYNDRLTDTDFTASPITVTTGDDSSDPNIGAFMLGGGDPVPDPSTPSFSGVKIEGVCPNCP